MRRSLASPCFALLLALLAASTAACGASSDSEPRPPAPTSTAASSATPRNSATAALVSSLRDVDFTQPPLAGDLIARAGGGEVTKERVRVLDLTSDGIEEAVVVVESGGTQGDIAVGIYRLEQQVPELAFFRRLSGRADVKDATLVISEGVPLPSDPLCCPSKLHEMTIGWKDGAFSLLSERTIDSPNGGTR